MRTMRMIIVIAVAFVAGALASEVLVLLHGIATASGQQKGIGKSKLGGNIVPIRGNTYAWEKGASRPLEGVEILVFRDGKTIDKTTSGKKGAFSLRAVEKGSPVVIILNYRGFVQGKVICFTTDQANQKEVNVDLSLISKADTANWDADAEQTLFKEYKGPR